MVRARCTWWARTRAARGCCTRRGTARAGAARRFSNLDPDAAQAAEAGLGAAAATLPQGGQLAVALNVGGGRRRRCGSAVATLHYVARAIPTVDVSAVPAADGVADAHARERWGRIDAHIGGADAHAGSDGRARPFEPAGGPADPGWGDRGRDCGGGAGYVAVVGPATVVVSCVVSVRGVIRSCDDGCTTVVRLEYCSILSYEKSKANDQVIS